MPSSDPAQIPRVLEVVRALVPRSVLDVGPGFGKYGLLLREYLEFWGDAPTGVDRASWRTRIDAVEAFGPYVTPLLREVYDEIHLCDVLQLLDVSPSLRSASRRGWDLILSCDQIEHLAPDDVPRFISLARARCRHLVIVTPKEPSKQGEAFGNPYEVHRSRLDPMTLPAGSRVETVSRAILAVVPGTWRSA